MTVKLDVRTDFRVKRGNQSIGIDFDIRMLMCLSKWLGSTLWKHASSVMSR